jgi:hypothetical protein
MSSPRKPRTISRHFLRRRARARRESILRMQGIVRDPNAERDARAIAAATLQHDRLTSDTVVTYTKTTRGPFRWRVIAG